jgi:peptidoglycan-associated lipoprotein
MTTYTRPVRTALSLLITLAAISSACGKKNPPVARPTPPPPVADPASARPPAPPQPVTEPVPVPPEPVNEDRISASSLDELNRNSPLQPVFFEYDSSQIEGPGQQILQATAARLRANPTWLITIEGHCDERGTAEYNLALGERRAVAARAYLVSLGISADRLRTVSYGKEFPFDPGHDEAAYARNRRAHFVITAQ